MIGNLPLIWFVGAVVIHASGPEAPVNFMVPHDLLWPFSKNKHKVETSWLYGFAWVEKVVALRDILHLFRFAGARVSFRPPADWLRRLCPARRGLRCPWLPCVDRWQVPQCHRRDFFPPGNRRFQSVEDSLGTEKNPCIDSIVILDPFADVRNPSQR